METCIEGRRDLKRTTNPLVRIHPSAPVVSAIKVPAERTDASSSTFEAVGFAEIGV
jgi:hypothetical protein